MSVKVTYPTLVSDTYLFADKDEAVAFFDALIVPSATTDAEGVVKKANSVAYTPFAAYSLSDVLSWEYAGESYETYNRATLDELRTKVLALSTALNDLLTKLRSAGIVT